jgi:hypothetical protein
MHLMSLVNALDVLLITFAPMRLYDNKLNPNRPGVLQHI